MDIYSVASQLKALELMPREYNFLVDTFGADMGAIENDEAIYDFRKGVKEMAPIVHPGQGGVVMARQGYETRRIGFCTIAPERVIEAEQLKTRMFGENILGAMTPEERSRKMLAQDLVDMRAAIQRRRAWMVREVLLTGKLSVFRYTNEGRDLETTMVADYGFTNNYTPTTKWDQVGAKIYDDLQAMYDIVYDGLGEVSMIVMAPDVWSVMKEDQTFMRTFDIRNADMGDIMTNYRGQGIRFLGRNADGVEMYSDSGKFVDDNGNVVPELPKGTLIMGGKGILKVPHGPVTQVESEGPDAQHKTYIKKEVPLRYGTIDGNAVKNRLTSRPTVVPFNVDAWCVGHVTTVE